MTSTRPCRARRPRLAVRRGSALLLVLIFTMALGALAMSAIYLTGQAAVGSRVSERDADLRYTADAALQMARAWVATDPGALPDTGFREIPLPGGTIRDASGVAIPGTAVRLYAGPTGSPTSSGTTFADLIADVRDDRGGHVIRRLEVTRESFAKFAYFTDRESTSGTIYFGPGDVVFGPAWSNDTISISAGTPAAEFRDSVWTVAPVVNGQANGSFRFAPVTGMRRIPLPSTATVARMRSLASAGGMAFDAPTNGAVSTTRMRLEFVAVDLNGDGDTSDRDEGFVRVYAASAAAGASWLRGDLTTGGSATSLDSYVNCGDWHTIATGERRFFPVAVHNDSWFQPYVSVFSPDSAAAVTTELSGTSAQVIRKILQRPGARCFPGGAPELAAIERGLPMAVGGADTTFTPSGTKGAWVMYPGAVDPRLATRRVDAAYLFPLSRLLNTTSRGVIDVNGTVAVSGVVTGRVTIHSNASILIVDDLTYVSAPGGATCLDILGMVADRDIVVADNAILTPQDIDPSSGTLWKSLDDTPDAWLNGVMMTLNTSFTVENYGSGPTSAQPCGGSARGRGCLYLVGGLIQNARGAVGTSAGTGFNKRYSYDRCAASNPPPYFPTTGRFLDNYYYEVDPVGFDPARAFAMLSPG